MPAFFSLLELVRMQHLAFLALLLASFAGGVLDAQEKTAPASKEWLDFFETKVRPVLAENCFNCHGAKKQQGGLRLDNRTDVLKGNEDGPIVVAGRPEKSRLI